MSKSVKRVLIWIAAMLFAGVAIVAVLVLRFALRLERVAAAPEAGFRSEYWLYAPRSMGATTGPLHLLVIPNNTGSGDDDAARHARAALFRTYGARELAEELATPLLVPCFPRPATNWRVYTHALDRDTFLTDVPELARLDLQLIAMIDDARARLVRETGREVDARVLLFGFSANGMFANRFALLHSERVLACAAGSPGGWPLAPIEGWKDSELRYPVGLYDAAELVGAPLDPARMSALQILVFQGSEDTNDSVAFDDGYDPEDRALVNNLFGTDLRARFDAAAELYRATIPGAVFRLHPGVGHERTDAMNADAVAFFRRVMSATR